MKLVANWFIFVKNRGTFSEIFHEVFRWETGRIFVSNFDLQRDADTNQNIWDWL